MAPKSAIFLFFLAIAVPIITANIAPAPKPHKVGGYQPIANPKSPMVVAVAKFAVAEHNKEKKGSLVFMSVLKGESQVVAGVNYKLAISTKDRATNAAVTPKTYIAVVNKNLKGALKLVSFVSYN